jgi:hypothetical protein
LSPLRALLHRAENVRDEPVVHDAALCTNVIFRRIFDAK